MFSTLMEWAKIAGIAGMAFGTLLYIYRAVIRKLATPDAKQSGKILTLIVIFTFTIGIVGLLVYLGILIFVPPDRRSAYMVEQATDAVDFGSWTPPSTDRDSIVKRTFISDVRRLTRTDAPFLARSTTTGTSIALNPPVQDVSFSEVTPKSGRTSHEYLLSVASDTFDRGTYTLDYTLIYANGWTSTKDNWVGKVIQYPTRNYHYILKFPSPWTSMRIMMQPPGSTENLELVTETNRDGRLTYEWQSTPNQILKPGTRIVAVFGWPPLTGSEQPSVTHDRL